MGVRNMTTDEAFVRTAQDLALRIARLADPNCELPRPRPHEGVTLTSGYSGSAVALLYAGEFFDDDGLRAAARTLLKRAAQDTVDHAVWRFGLFDGLAGFASVLVDFVAVEPRYLPTLERTADQLGNAMADAVRPQPGDGIPFEAYDVACGAAGQLATALRLMSAMDRPPASVTEAALLLTDYLVQVTDLDDHGRPGWLLTPNYYPVGLDWYGKQSPHGMYNLGFAHGMPGILAALSGAAAVGIGGAAVVKRVQDLAEWLTVHTCDAGKGPTWPTAYNASPDSKILEYDKNARPARAAWCYGAPGIALALLSATAATNEPKFADTAVAALRRIVTASSHERNVSQVSLCHGHAGLATIAHRAATITGLDEFTSLRDQQLQAVVAKADPARPFLFADQPAPGEFIDDPGFLNGASGVLLSLLAPLAPTRTLWDEMLFLTPQSMVGPVALPS